jgi:hypothetical protein
MSCFLFRCDANSDHHASVSGEGPQAGQREFLTTHDSQATSCDLSSPLLRSDGSLLTSS